MQKIDNIEIKNFKSIRQAEIKDCRRVNIFIGYPNVGKSNILEALSLFSVTGIDKTISKLIRFENSTTLFFNGNISEKAEIKINTTNRILLDYIGSSVKFLNQFDIEQYGFDVIDNAGFLEHKEALGLANFEVPHNSKKITSFGGGGYSNRDGALARIYKYQFERDIKYTSGSSFHLSDPLGENIFDIISSNESIRKDVIEIFKEYNLRFSFDKSTREFKILKDVGDDIFLISYSMIADTLQRLIFYKTAIKSNTDSVLLFEEPEAHMFPPHISKFTSDIIFDKNDNQYFIATHSPFVLNDFMEDIDKNELSIYAIGYKNDTGETIVHRLTDDEIAEVYQYGIDLFFNLENYLKDVV